jgi:hypothetical protein
MKMKRIVEILALGMMIGFVPAAGAITTDGDWSDWFTYGGNVAFNTWNENLVTLDNTGIRTQNDEEGPTPGGGGQRYDIEQIFYMFQDSDPNALTGGTLRIGMVTGFPPEGRPSDDLYAGDMFIDFGNTGGYDFAVATSTSGTNAEVPGGVDSDYFGNNYVNDGTANWGIRNPTQFPGSTPWRVDRNAAIENQLASTVAWGQMGVHYFLEIAVDVDGGLEDILTNPQGGVGLHWTMECGNDVIDVHDDVPFAPIPEPSTFILLGMGTLGAMLRKKFIA